MKIDTMSAIAEGLKIGREFNHFTKGVRVLFLIHRSKEGGKSSNGDHLKKVVTRNSEEFGAAVAELLAYKNEAAKQGKTLRLYSCVNARNVDKAIRTFKYLQLDADYYGEEDRHSFYFDVRNRWVSALMQPRNKVTSHFVLDIDTKEQATTEEVHVQLAKAGAKVLKEYETKNGIHVITEPFNPALLDVKDVEINKDGLILLSY